MDELQQLAKLEKEFEDKKNALLEKAKEIWLTKAAALSAEGKLLGFTFEQLNVSTATDTGKAPSSTGNRKQMSVTDILEAQKAMLAYLKSKKGSQQSAAEIFDGLGYEKGRRQTIEKHLKVLLTSGQIEATLKDTTKGKSPKNPTAYLWVKDLDN